MSYFLEFWVVSLLLGLVGLALFLPFSKFSWTAKKRIIWLTCFAVLHAGVMIGLCGGLRNWLGQYA